MLVIFVFMTNVGLWDDHSDWLDHELEHSVLQVPMTNASDHIGLHDVHLDEASDGYTGLAVEHELLHAADHLQHFLSTGEVVTSSYLSKMINVSFNFLQIPLSTYDTPFRPPRIFPLLSLL